MSRQGLIKGTLWHTVAQCGSWQLEHAAGGFFQPGWACNTRPVMMQTMAWHAHKIYND